MIDFLSDKVRKERACFQGRGLNEIRLRIGCPISLTVNGEKVNAINSFANAKYIPIKKGNGTILMK